MHPQRHGIQVQPEETPGPGSAIQPVLADNSAELVERVRTGDAYAWRELVREYEPMMRRIARQFRLSSQDADDVVQLSWLRCLEHLDQLTHADRLRAWLGTICRRECLRLATRGRPEIPLGESAITRLIDNSREEHDPFTTAALRDDHARLSQAITALPDRQRLVLLELLERGGHGYVDVSRRLGLPIGSIGPTWQRALTRLRRDPGLADLNPAS
jgi:RNA polymerase sigma factor (sigma-70 family)